MPISLPVDKCKQTAVHHSEGAIIGGCNTPKFTTKKLMIKIKLNSKFLYHQQVI